MSSTIIQPLADLIATTIESLQTDFTVNGYSNDPGFAGLDSLPCGIVGLPIIDRVDVDEAESQFGSNDWRFEFPITFLFDLGNSDTAQAQALDTVERFIQKIDSAALSVSDPSIVDAKVTRSEGGEILDASRPLLSYNCTLRVLKLQT
ncbi:MAG: hypothetical protein WCO96_01195 [Actinomycetes bacterium]|jgi:hypothetical protein